MRILALLGLLLLAACASGSSGPGTVTGSYVDPGMARFCGTHPHSGICP